AILCWNTNPVTQAPEADKVVAGLAREDLFLVVADHFVSDTARYADIVLPAAMGAEMEDIILAWGHNYLTYNARCVEPPGEAVSNAELFRRLARRFGFTDERLYWSDEECLRNFVAWDAPACAGITLETLRARGYARLQLGDADTRTPHRDGNFPTPSGKCEFKSSIAAHGNFVPPPFRQMYEAFQGGEPVDALPDYVPPRESVLSNPALAARYPLSMVSPKSHAFLNSCYANMTNKRNTQGEQSVLIHPDDAAARRVADGARVRVFNGRGAFEAVARVSTDVNPGVVVTTLGHWRQHQHGTVNAISSAEFADLGHAPSFSDNLVEVALA
ncbi:MAG: molybdopterin-dependent oxidoreductase, partial [Gammaproteobacteria bacterium]|nr:molybdopterin-dependent oxidoreductase [Gammaproteobacteria bacterium]